MNIENVKIGRNLFKYRDYTPIPLLVLLLTFGHPTALSATIGILIAVLGELLRIYSSAFIGGISRTQKDSLGTNLVTSGPYGFTRNPLYIANFLICLGVGIFSGLVWITLLSVFLCFVQYSFIILYEETLLKTAFGEEFLLYKETVPRWIPQRRPILKEITWPVSFSDALFNERWTITSLVSVLLLVSIIKQ